MSDNPTAPRDPSEEQAEEAVTQANDDLNDQGDIAADDAGGTAAGHRVQDALEKTPRAPD
ncbi:hypothetical protein [uncultured Caulobacter sp.]|jgi:hypothetical protein|uniref:hypothetical protein n=1 Tax=uncultured Caulobacter sp. TaxID=158749 RepID=UPI00261C4191|nr:hypothetical protein [uncultured Caulobacter sp.]